MAKYISPADTAKEVRKALKEAFPDQKFSVRTDVYAGGASVRVRYTDGPNEKAVEKVAKQFEGSTFDPMLDLKEYRQSEHNGEQVHWGADYVFVNRDFSEEVDAKAKEFTALAIAEDGGTSGADWYGEAPQAFLRASHNDEHFGFQTNYWVLVTVAAAWIAEGRTLVVKVTA